MGPSCRRKTIKSTRKSSRKKTLFKSSSKNQQSSALVPTADSPAKPSDGSSKADVFKDAFDDVGMSHNSSGSCSTPKAERFRIPEITTCPPAPKKRRMVRNCSFKRTAGPVPFFTSPDIELFFYFALRGIAV